MRRNNSLGGYARGLQNTFKLIMGDPDLDRQVAMDNARQRSYLADAAKKEAEIAREQAEEDRSRDFRNKYNILFSESGGQAGMSFAPAETQVGTDFFHPREQHLLDAADKPVMGVETQDQANSRAMGNMRNFSSGLMKLAPLMNDGEDFAGDMQKLLAIQAGMAGDTDIARQLGIASGATNTSKMYATQADQFAHEDGLAAAGDRRSADAAMARQNDQQAWLKQNDPDAVKARGLKDLLFGKGEVGGGLPGQVAVGAAPSVTQQNAAALATLPEETRQGVAVGGTGITATDQGFQPNATIATNPGIFNKPATGGDSVKWTHGTFQSPDGQTMRPGMTNPQGARVFADQDGDMSNNEPVPADWMKAPNRVMQGTPGEFADVTLGDSTQEEAAERVVNMKEMNILLDMAEASIDANPQQVGASGKIARGIRGVAGAVSGVAWMAENPDVAARVQELSKDIIAGPEFSEVSTEYKIDAQAALKGDLSAAKMYHTLVTYKAAAALAGQTGRAVSDRDVALFGGLMGDPEAWLANPEQIKQGIDRLRGVLDALLPVNIDTAKGLVDTSANGLARPETQADYDALPSGAIYIDPEDGNQYRKP